MHQRPDQSRLVGGGSGGGRGLAGAGVRIAMGHQFGTRNRKAYRFGVR
jgi:hypothetical protein